MSGISFHDTPVKISKAMFHKTGESPDALGEIDGEQDGTDGGQLEFHTKTTGGNVTEKLRINNKGAIGIAGPYYGTSGQILVSKGENNPVEWADHAPDQTVTLNYGGATVVSGTYPNFTITSTDTNTNTTYSAGNGIVLNGTQFNVGTGSGSSNNVTFQNIYSNAWFRVKGGHGIYWENFYGGWQMTDTLFVKMYNNKSLYVKSGENSGYPAATFESVTPHGTPSTYRVMRLRSPNGFWGLYINNASSSAIRGTSGERNNDLIFTWNETRTNNEYEAGGYYLDSNWSGGDGIDFTGQHRSLSNKNLKAEHYGLIVVSSGKYINLNNSLKPSINESLCIVELCKENNSKNVYGVLSDKEDSNQELRIYKTGGLGQKMKKPNINDDRIIINSLGEGAIWVSNKNGNLINGDYITSSSLIGYGMKQNEDILYNFTVAKITCDCDFNLIKKPKQKIKQIKKEKIIKKYQTKIVKESVTKQEVIFDEITNTYVNKNIVSEKETEVELYDEYDLYDEDGKILPYKHKVYRFYDEIQYTYEIVYDENGDILFENDLDENGNIQYEYDYETRFLDENTNILSGEEEYLSKLNNGDNVYIACLVGCTYHCG